MPAGSGLLLSHTARACCTCRASFPDPPCPRALLRVIFVPREPTVTPSSQARALIQSAARALARPRPSIARLSIQSVVRMDSRGIKRPQNPLLSSATHSTLAQDFARQQVSKQQHSNFHSSSISPILNFNMVSQSVNKTNLHPSGVVCVSLSSPSHASCLPPRLALCKDHLTDQYSPSSRPSKGHTEIEEALHDKAHIDYDRVAIVSIYSQTTNHTSNNPNQKCLRLPTLQLLLSTKML